MDSTAKNSTDKKSWAATSAEIKGYPGEEHLTYVIQVPSEFVVESWTTVRQGLTMGEAYGVLEGYRRQFPKKTFRLIPTDWIDL